MIETCPQCGSTEKGYMRNSCAAVWGKWHPWHDERKTIQEIMDAPRNPHYAVEETWRDKMAAILTPAYVDPTDLYGG